MKELERLFFAYDIVLINEAHISPTDMDFVEAWAKAKGYALVVGCRRWNFHLHVVGASGANSHEEEESECDNGDNEEDEELSCTEED